jgi:hypothetical protein
MSDARSPTALAVVRTLKLGRRKDSAASAPKLPHARGKKHREST